MPPKSSGSTAPGTPPARGISPTPDRTTQSGFPAPRRCEKRRVGPGWWCSSPHRSRRRLRPAGPAPAPRSSYPYSMAMSSGVLPSCPRKPLRAITSAWPSCNIQQRGAAVRGLAVDIRADYLHTRWPTFNLADTPHRRDAPARRCPAARLPPERGVVTHPTLYPQPVYQVGGSRLLTLYPRGVGCILRLGYPVPVRSEKCLLHRPRRRLGAGGRWG